MAAASATLIGKRVNFVLSERAYSELASLAKETRRTMTELVRLGLGLVKLAIDAQSNGHRLVVTNAAGEPVKEIVLPH